MLSDGLPLSSALKEQAEFFSRNEAGPSGRRDRNPGCEGKPGKSHPHQALPACRLAHKMSQASRKGRWQASDMGPILLEKAASSTWKQGAQPCPHCDSTGGLQMGAPRFVTLEN